MTALRWKRFYEAERARLGEAGLVSLLDRAPAVAPPSRGALVIPHTRLEASGALIAAAANAVVRAGADEVLAVGVLHGAREADAEMVARARAGDAMALAELRRVHGPGATGDSGRWTEEFSFDAFSELVDLAARRAGRRPPRIIARYPFLVGDHPDDLPGLDELRRLRAGGVPVVATADPIHHGVGYRTPVEARRARADAATIAWARSTVEEGFGLLARREYRAFLDHAAATGSDFRDAGPALVALLDGPMEVRVRDAVLVSYAEVLGAEEPTWVAAALAEFTGRA